MESLSDKLIIFDLDETLIHATEIELGMPHHFRVGDYFVYQRPGLEKFLADIAQHFSIGIWSSADDEYVAEMVRQIVPADVDLKIVWGRSRCSLKRDVFDNYCYEKRLDKLKKRGFRLEQIILVDDSPAKARANYGNALYVREFRGSPEDQELSHLYDYLLSLKSVGNVRSIEKRGWRTV